MEDITTIELQHVKNEFELKVFFTVDDKPFIVKSEEQNAKLKFIG